MKTRTQDSLKTANANTIWQNAFQIQTQIWENAWPLFNFSEIDMKLYFLVKLIFDIKSKNLWRGCVSLPLKLEARCWGWVWSKFREIDYLKNLLGRWKFECNSTKHEFLVLQYYRQGYINYVEKYWNWYN